jgi:putative DNA methylase
MTVDVKSPRKLIEVALPLDAINSAAAREKSIRNGHPSTLHLWWARRPLAAARAVIFAQLVNDPGFQQNAGFRYGMNKKAAAEERRRLFTILEELVKWENTNNQEVLDKARNEIRRSWREVCDLNKDHPEAATLFNPDKIPAFHDPFAGGGAIPLEAQRLGLESFASDLNPVAVLINKAMIEIPSHFAGRTPIGPIQSKIDLELKSEWPGSSGLAEDIRRYGTWLREEALKRLEQHYSQVEITPELSSNRIDLRPLTGEKLTVIAWLWARTVKSPNPAFNHVDVPLTTTFVLSSRVGNMAFVQPQINGDSYDFTVKLGTPPPKAEFGTKFDGRGANFKCIVSNTPIGAEYIKAEAKAGRMGQRLLAIVAEAPGGRVYLSPTRDAEAIAFSARPQWIPDIEFFQKALGFRVGNYGMSKWSDLFTQRQLVCLSTLVDLLETVRAKVRADVITCESKMPGSAPLSADATAIAYADAVSIYLSFAISKVANIGSSLASWMNDRGAFRETFARQALPMVWDFAEANPFSDAGGSFSTAIEKCAKSIESLPVSGIGHAIQESASVQTTSERKFVSTDPPYYDNIGYADLSDFFYVWLRRGLRNIYPDLFATLTVPKEDELVATPARHGGAREAGVFFLNGMTSAMQRLSELAHPAAPITIYYAFKQSETDSGSDTSSAGWESFLEAVLRSGFQIVGTWPVRTEGSGRMRGQSSNALASSIVLVCRKRSLGAQAVSRRDFLRELNQSLPEALDGMTRGAGDDYSPVAPVDLSQAIIGPGMAIYSKYSAVLEADGTPMSVRTALQLINRFLANDDFDPDTQFCIHWFETYRWEKGKFGEADVLARAKGTSVEGLATGGVLKAAGGSVQLLAPNDLTIDWSPERDARLSVWEILHHLISKMTSSGEQEAGGLLARVHRHGEQIRTLAYRLYTICERRNWATDAASYNNLILAWDAIDKSARDIGYSGVQRSLFNEEVDPVSAAVSITKPKKTRKRQSGVGK